MLLIEKIHKDDEALFYADKDHLDVEIALQDVHKPIGVAEYQLLLPTKELEAMLMNELNNFNAAQDNEEA